MNGRDKFTIMSLFTGDVYSKHLSRLDPRRALRPLFFPLETIFHRSTAAPRFEIVEITPLLCSSSTRNSISPNLIADIFPIPVGGDVAVSGKE